MKGRDRIKEKACAITESLDRTTEQAVFLIPDTLRYTFQYQEARYTQGVWMDIGRLNDQGSDLRKSAAGMLPELRLMIRDGLRKVLNFQ